MARNALIGLLVCGSVWLGGAGLVAAHDERWGDHDTADEFRPGPPDSRGLEPYGEWVWEPEYGRVWRPAVGADWRPYWRGHWAWQGDWVWVSADPWGDGPFHYGEWARSGRFGWVWIPGSVWAPARVTWMVSGSIIAWAPAGLHVSVGSDPRIWVYADARMIRGPVIHPYRIHPPRARVRGGVVTRDLGRVVAPERQPFTREFRPDPGWERTRAVSPERRVVAPRRSSRDRMRSPDAPRGRAGEFRPVRGSDARAR